MSKEGKNYSSVICPFLVYKGDPRHCRGPACALWENYRDDPTGPPKAGRCSLGQGSAQLLTIRT